LVAVMMLIVLGSSARGVPRGPVAYGLRHMEGRVNEGRAA